MKVFWSWQSDTPGRTGRHLVRDALDAAIQRLKQMPDVEEPTEREARSALHLDQDRKGISGSPDLARVILEKIEQSAVFVADVTPVCTSLARVDDPPKKLINSNVAIELGYALHALSDRSLLMVMNGYYGGRADLPFDLQSKAGPIMFNLAPDAGKDQIRSVFQKLTLELSDALALCAAHHAETVRENAASSRGPFPEARSTYSSAVYFDENEPLAQMLGERKYYFVGNKLIYLRMYPSFDDQPRVGLAKMVSAFETGRAMPLSASSRGIDGRNRFGPITFDPRSGPAGIIDGLTQGFPSGELWGTTGVVFQPVQQRAFGLPEREGFAIPVFDFEKIYIRTLQNYRNLLTMVFGLRPPFAVQLGASGVNNVYVAKGRLHGPIMDNNIDRSYMLDDASDAEIMKIECVFFRCLRSGGHCQIADVFGR
jgi:hypothetical protein